VFGLPGAHRGRIVQRHIVPGDRMTDQELFEATSQPLTPRQDRIEAAIDRVLRAGGTRSQLREHVYQFADLARVQGTPAERAISALKAIVLRSTKGFNASTVGDSAADRMAMIVRWCTARYYRAD
jgi:hypothetical protein